MLFVLGPCITLTFALLGWAIIPFGEGLAIFDFELGVFFALAVSSLGGYGILISGWAANSKYAFLGAIRATAQLLSYELVFSSIVLILILFSGSFSLTYIVECQQAVWNIFPLMPIALAFFIAILAETNRPPFDLAEAESELVAGLCEMWLYFSLICIYITQKIKIIKILYYILGPFNRGWNTLSWVLGLMHNKNNNLNNLIGILSDLLCMLFKYVNKIINPLKDNFSYKKWYYIIIKIIDGKFHTWTSKIMDPSERYTPCIEIVPLLSYIENKKIYNFLAYNINKSILLYKFKPGNSIFNNLSLNIQINHKEDRIIKDEIFFLNKNYENREDNEIKIIDKSIKDFVRNCSNIAIKSKFNYLSCNYEWKRLFYSKGKIKDINKELNIYINKNCGSLYYITPKIKRIVSNINSSDDIFHMFCPIEKKNKDNKIKENITEKNKTKSRSNKWKYIISEKSRKHIILGSDGETYLDKINNFFNGWWYYYIIRKCNSGEILYEYHSLIKKDKEGLHSPFVPPYEEFPAKINKFLNYTKKFREYNLERSIGIINDIMIDNCTELNQYYNNKLQVEKKEFKPFKLPHFYDNEFKYLESNIGQYYSFCNNKNVYVGWVSIIRIKNYSSQPTYYNNLIKRYHKEWINMLKCWVVVPNNNLKCNSNTKMNNTNIPSDITMSNIFNSHIKDGTRMFDNCIPSLYSMDKVDINIKGKPLSKLIMSNDLNLLEPKIPKKYQNKFNYERISIKKINIGDPLFHMYFNNIKKRNKLPWALKESITKTTEIIRKEFVKVLPKYR